jgi:hypothetical protein
MDKEQKETPLSDLETFALMVLKDSRPDCYLRRTKNYHNRPVYKLMDGHHNPVTYIICETLDRLRSKRMVMLTHIQNSDYRFRLKL